MTCSVSGYQAATASGTGAIASGINAKANGAGAIAQGQNAQALTAGSVAIGSGAQANGDPTVAVGNNAVANGNNSVALGAGSTANGNNSVALGAGSMANQDNTVSVGSPGNERRITNVAPGVNPTDAVNVSQLNGVSSSINTLSRAAYSGIAMGAALSGIPQVDTDKNFNIGAGVGGYSGYSAIAVGASARLNPATVVKVGVSSSSVSHVMFSAGVGYSW